MHLAVQQRRQDWIEQTLAGEEAVDDGKKVYVKLAPSEKQLAVELYDATFQNTQSVRETIAYLKTLSRFASVDKKSIDDYRSTLRRAPGPSAQGTKGGRPPTVSAAIKDQIKAKV